MTRPRKNTVDYFPHIVKNGKTIFILEQKYKNDGYAIWFKILEILAHSENHYYDCNNEMQWEFLKSKMLISEELLLEILNLLSKLNAIDEELWKNKIIWSDHFVENISDVYKKRQSKTPLKPLIGHPKPRIDGVSDSGNPQSKLKYIKVNESKEKKVMGDFSLFSKNDLPAILQNDDLVAELNAWASMRKKMKKELNPHSADLSIKRLGQLSNNSVRDAIEIVRLSIVHNWIGLFDLKPNHTYTTPEPLDPALEKHLKIEGERKAKRAKDEAEAEATYKLLTKEQQAERREKSKLAVAKIMGDMKKL